MSDNRTVTTNRSAPGRGLQGVVLEPKLKGGGRHMATQAATKIQPLADRIVVKALEETEQMRGGLYIPDTAKEKPQQGEVVAAGPGKLNDDGKRVPLEVAVGNRILYGKYSGTEVNVDGEEYLILRESDVLAIIK
jgi:chaperonin GroES